MYDRRSQLANSWAAKSQQERHFMRACQQFYAPAAAEPILLRSLLLFRITVKEKKKKSMLIVMKRTWFSGDI